MAKTTPTRQITHKEGTIAHVPITDRIRHRLDNELPLSPGDQDNVAIAFKKTEPVVGRNMSHDPYVDFADLTILHPLDDPSYGDAPVRTGPGGVVLDDSDYGEE